MMASLLDEVAADRMGELLVLKLDPDANPRSAEHHGIRGIPTLIAFHGGREAGRQVGLASRRELDELVQRALPSQAG